MSETQTTTEKNKHEGKALTFGNVTSLVPKDFPEAERLAAILAKSDIVPKDFQGKPANILVALMFANELGLSPAQGLQNIMVVNGRPALWGDAVMAKVLGSGQVEAWEDSYDDKTKAVTFRIKRKGQAYMERTFSMEDAKVSGLDKKPGPWQQYPKRMLFHRARSWALRDAFADVLKGVSYYEEIRDAIDLEETERKTYEMPRRRSEAPANPEPQPAPAQIEQKGEVLKIRLKEWKEQKVSTGGFRIVPPIGNPFFTDSQGVMNAAKKAREEGKEIDIEYDEGVGENEILFLRPVEPAK